MSAYISVVVLGPSRSGKTSFVTAVLGRDKAARYGYGPTHEVNHHSTQIDMLDGTEITVCIADTPAVVDTLDAAKYANADVVIVMALNDEQIYHALMIAENFPDKPRYLVYAGDRDTTAAKMIGSRNKVPGFLVSLQNPAMCRSIFTAIMGRARVELGRVSDKPAAGPRPTEDPAKSSQPEEQPATHEGPSPDHSAYLGIAVDAAARVLAIGNGIRITARGDADAVIEVAGMTDGQRTSMTFRL